MYLRECDEIELSKGLKRGLERGLFSTITYKNIGNYGTTEAQMLRKKEKKN